MGKYKITTSIADKKSKEHRRLWLKRYRQAKYKENPDFWKTHSKYNKEWCKQRYYTVIKRRKKWLNFYKELVGCFDCKVKYPYYILDFDHRDIFSKDFTILASYGINSNLKILINEVRKCDVVCSNCHRIRTHLNKENIMRKTKITILGGTHGSSTIDKI